MNQDQNHFEFTSAIFKEGRRLVSLCLDVHVASQGTTIREAKKLPAEAVSISRVVLKAIFLTFVRFPEKKIPGSIPART